MPLITARSRFIYPSSLSPSALYSESRCVRIDTSLRNYLRVVGKFIRDISICHPFRYVFHCRLYLAEFVAIVHFGFSIQFPKDTEGLTDSVF